MNRRVRHFPGGRAAVGTGRGTDAPFANGVLNPDEKESKTDQFSASIERQLAPNFAVRTTGIHAHAFNVRRVVNTLRPYEVYNIPITNRDPARNVRSGVDYLRPTAIISPRIVEFSGSYTF